MPRDKFCTFEQAVASIPEGATLAVSSSGGGLMEADRLLGAIEQSFLQTGHPRDLTLVFSLGFGDGNARGLNRFRHKGMVRRVIGSHWSFAPPLQQAAEREEIEAYVLPAGVMGQLMREIGAGRPGLITSTGLDTFVDPRNGGGRLNKRTTEDLVERIQLDGKEYLRYKPFAIDACVLRGSFADPDGNISFEQEGGNLDAQSVALATRASGGNVIVQVRTAVTNTDLRPRSVRIPGACVDHVVVDPDQQQSYQWAYDPVYSGERVGLRVAPAPKPFTVREVIALRAAEELADGAVVNFGFGVPDGVANAIVMRGDEDRYYQTLEHGTFGGETMAGMLLGFCRNARAMLDSPTMFDFYGGGGLDITFLGAGEIDASGNVNVSKLNGLTVGPGGFVDISQNARKVVFCCTFEAKGADVLCGGGRLLVRSHGKVAKLVEKVEQVTFSGKRAVQTGQEVIYVTERAVFELTREGLVLTEIAPGVDLHRDVLERMGFQPIIPRPPKVMDASHFTEPDWAHAASHSTRLKDRS